MRFEYMNGIVDWLVDAVMRVVHVGGEASLGVP